MINYKLGKLAVLAGYALSLLSYILQIAMNLLMGYVGRPILFTTIIGLFSLIILAAQVGGFGIMFLDRRNILDLGIAGAILLNFAITIIRPTFVAPSQMAQLSLMNIIVLAFGLLPRLIWAYKLKDKTPIAALGLCATVAWAVLVTVLKAFFPATINWVEIIVIIINLACYGAYLFAAYSEE